MAPYDRIELKDKTIVITGVTQGIGYHAAIELARTGARLVTIVRNADKGREVLTEIERVSGHKNHQLIIADLSVLADVRRAAEEVLGANPKIHVLLNNAGGVFMTPQYTPDGFERTFALNHLAYFELTRLLLDRLIASGPARIVNVSSAAHYRALRLDLDDVAKPRKFSGMRIYCQSKLCNLLFTYELARRLEGKNVTVNAVHPGLIASGFGHNNKGWMGLWSRLGRPLMRSSESGSKGLVFLATARKLTGQTGGYYHTKIRMVSSPISRNERLQAGLWALSERLTQHVAHRAA